MKEYPLEYNGLLIDPVIFTQGFVPGCNVNICSGECCDWGVYMDAEFKNMIMKFESEIINVMDDAQHKNSDKWFEKEVLNDSDFPSGLAIGTEIYKNNHGKYQCVFKDKKNFCSIQVAAVKHNMHKWSIKPTYCIMYPLTIVDGILTYDLEHSKKLSYCGLKHHSNFTQTVFEAMSEEIRYVLGDDGYNFLNEYFLKHYKHQNL